MSPQEIRQRFLNAIAGPESAGRYDVRYTPRGGATFTGFETHPRIYEPGPKGPSSAAGRYQITYQTYKRLGGGSFTPEAQDEMAWRLGVQDYKSRTGRDLEADLRDQGFTPQMMQVLAPTWVGLKDNPRKAAEWFRRPLSEGGAEFRPQTADTTQVGSPISPEPMTPAPYLGGPKMTYAPDVMTQAQRFGSFLTGGAIPEPEMIPQEQADLQARQAAESLRQQQSAIAPFQAMMAAGMREDAMRQRPMSLLQPSFVRGQYSPIQTMRGLL